jgi:methylglutaconyl-CoA hydratase
VHTVSEELVHLVRVGPVAMIVLDSPANRNALSRRLVAQLQAALAEAEASARGIVVTHRGPVFCSGADLKEPRTEDHPSNALFDLVGRISRPVVAVVRGPARGGGVGLAAACDVVLAAESSNFGLPEVRVGIVPAKVAVPLFRRVRPGVAAALLLTGAPVAADRARDLGLVDLVTADDAVEGELQGLLSEMLAGSPTAQAAAKVVLRDDGSVPARPSGSDDGAAAFLAGRGAPWEPGTVPRLELPSLSL